MGIIKHVRGNVLRLAIPLTMQTVEVVNGTATATNTNFIPSIEHPVTVEFISRATKCRLTAAMHEGNIAVIEDKGTIPEGTYSLTVCCRDDNGNPMRFKQKCVLQVVDTTAEAGIEEWIEYEVGTWYLDAAVFLAIGGGGSINITVDDELNDSSEHPVQNKVVKAALDGKQESIPDLDDIRRGAATGATALQEQKRADWEEADPDDPAYILNKPNLFGGSYNDLTDKPTIPDEQEQSDWNESDNTKKAFIKNKPTIPAPQVNADWNASSGAAQILNKPTIPAAQVQSDWNATTGMGVILNKPTIPDVSGFLTSEDFKTVNGTSIVGSGDIAINEVIQGKVDNGKFYAGTFVLGNWAYSVTPSALALDTLYVDISTKKIYHYNGTALVELAAVDLSGKADVVTVVTVSDTGAVSQALDAGKFYKFTGALTSLTLTLNAASSGLAIYAGKFTSDSTTATTLSVPQTVTEASGNPTIEAGKTYEFSIADNVLLMVEV